MTKVVDIKALGKRYTISHEKEAMVRHIFPRFLSIKRYEEFWALQDIDLEINKGECLGVTGSNGAGKSTLLNMLAGVTFPSRGSVKIDGKVSAMLSLGAGFHPELTGEENIYLNASLLGLGAKEIKKRFQDIVEFSGLNNFIDAPLKVYSTGMYMRLGFAVAVSVDFDILLIDELISVGDIAFQDKCLKKLNEFRRLQKTLVIVSQSLSLIKDLSDRVVILEKGRIKFQGDPKEAIADYEELMSTKEKEHIQLANINRLEPVSRGNSQNLQSEEKPKGIKSGWGTKSGNGDIEITKVRLLNSKGQEQLAFETGQRVNVWVDFIVHNEIVDPHFGVAIFRDDGTYCYGPNTRFDGIKIPRLKKGEGWFSLEYRELNLLPGNYKISVGIWEKEEKFAYDYHEAFYDLKIYSSKEDHGIAYLRHNWNWKLP